MITTLAVPMRTLTEALSRVSHERRFTAVDIRKRMYVCAINPDLVTEQYALKNHPEPWVKVIDEDDIDDLIVIYFGSRALVVKADAMQ